MNNHNTPLKPETAEYPPDEVIDVTAYSRLTPLDSVRCDKFEDWASTFGLSEFEDMAMRVVKFLRSENPSKHHLLNLRSPTGAYVYERGVGWTKKFVIEDVTERGHSVFAAMCVAGYFKHEWFPKWCFTVTDEFIARCPLASYKTRFARDPGSRGYPNARNNYPESDDDEPNAIGHAPGAKGQADE